MANLGYIGLGAMGGRIADRLLSKGHTLIGHNPCFSTYWPSFQEFPHDHRHEDGD
jgi:phosphoglycerate dehydrogenase-like enzyme